MTYRPTGRPPGRPRKPIPLRKQYVIGERVEVSGTEAQGTLRRGMIVWKGSRRFRLLLDCANQDPMHLPVFFYRYEQITQRFGVPRELTVESTLLFEIAKRLGRNPVHTLTLTPRVA